MRGRVTASERAYEQYKAESGLLDPGGENLSNRQIAKLNEELVTARARAAEARAKFEQLKQITPDKLHASFAGRFTFSQPDQAVTKVNVNSGFVYVARTYAP